MRRTVLALAAVTLSAILAGCGSSSSHPIPKPYPSLTAAQAARICQDMNSWLVGAVNQNEPTFNATLTADEQKARRTELGHDLSNLDYVMQTEHVAALIPSGPPGSPTAFGELAKVCAGHGVTLKLGD